jgi:hypothetical protein
MHVSQSLQQQSNCCSVLQHKTVRSAYLRHHVFQRVIVRSHTAQTRLGAARNSNQLALPGTGCRFATENGVEGKDAGGAAGMQNRVIALHKSRQRMSQQLTWRMAASAVSSL